jgi:hypothetical protein
VARRERRSIQKKDEKEVSGTVPIDTYAVAAVKKEKKK